MFEALGSHTYRFRFLIVAVWIAGAAAAGMLAPSLAGRGTADQASFLPAGVPSVVAQEAIGRAFPGSTSTSSATITFSRETGLTDADRAYRDAFAAWTQSAGAPPALRKAVTGVDSATSRPELASMLRSTDGKLELLNVNLSVSSAGDDADAVVSALREHAATGAPVGLAVHVTGSTGITTDYIKAIKSGTDSTTMVTVALVLIILLLIYRAPLAALVPLVTIGAAFLVTRGVLGLLAAAGWEISSLLDTFTVVLVFGVGTDYTIFLISRYREEVRAGDWHDASRRTVRRIGAVISASAATVIVGLGAMAFGDFGMIRTTGPALAVAIFVTLVAGLTLTPALLAIFGHYLFWPLHERTGSEVEPEGFFARLAGFVTRHPGVVTAVIVLALLVPAAFLPQMRTNFDTLAELPPGSDARAGFDEVATHLGRGKLVQSTGLIAADGRTDMLAPAQLARLRDTMERLSAVPGVGSVTSLVTPAGDGKVPDGFRPSVQLADMAGSFASGSEATAGSSGTTSSLLDPKLSTGLSGALDYVNALGLAFPDVAARSESRAAAGSIEKAQSIVERVRTQSVVSTQLRTLASALTSPAAMAAGTSAGTSPGPASGASGGSSDSGLIADYLAELARAYPEVRDLPAFRDATRAAASLERAASAKAALDASAALDRLALHFDALPDARLAATSLSKTASAIEARKEATAAFEAIAPALRDLGGVFEGRPDDIFVPVGLAGTEADSLKKAVDAFVSADRSATRFYMTAKDDPYSSAAFGMVRRAQDELAAAAPSFGPGAVAALDGPTAQLSDVQDVLQSDFVRVGVITVLGILLVLMILLRAVVAPIYLVATVLLSYASAVGLSAWLFQGLFGHVGVSFYLPLLVFVLLVALGSDYNIFLMSRVREESETRPIRDGIRIASGHTGAVITSAGLILAGTFGSMATAPLAVLFQIGIAVAIGVLIDTFVVRSVLVPAITTLVGDRAWWPSGSRLAARLLAPAPVAAGSAVAGSAVLATVGDDRALRSPLRLAAAVALAILVPVTFAALIVWARPTTGTPAVHAAVVDGDAGATTTTGDGTTRTLRLGADLAATLTGAAAPATGGPIWTGADASSAASGLADGRYDAVLTIPADYSRAIAAIAVDRTGALPAPILHLEMGDGAGVTTAEIARAVEAAVAQTASREATASYVGDLLLAVDATHGDLTGAATSAHDVAARLDALASDASGAHTVTRELASGLDTLASGASGAAGGAATLANGTRALARGAEQLAEGAGSLATGTARTADGAAKLSSGAGSLAEGLATLDRQTAALPSQVGQLDAGASGLATGASSAASGATQLADGLATLRSGTTGMGAQAATLDDGVGRLVLGAEQLKAGASDAAAGAGKLSTATVQLDALINGDAANPGYVATVAALAAGCTDASSGVCVGLQGLARLGPTLTALSGGVRTGAGQMAGASQGIASGVSGLATGITTLRAGTSALAASAPQLEGAIAQSASGASSLATGVGQLATGASSLAEGTHQLAAGMPALSDGVSALASGAASVASGASSLSDGIVGLARGAEGVATGARQEASGTASLAAGTSSAAAGTERLVAAMRQVADGARVAEAGAGRIASDGRTLAGDAAKKATSLDAATAGAPSYPPGVRDRVAEQFAAPVSIDAVAAAGGAGFAPYIAALALWLGALAALVVLPAGRRRGGARSWATPLAAFGAAAALGLVAAGVMVAGLLLVGLSVARPVELLAVAALAAAAFVAVVQALVVVSGRRGWLLGLLLAGVQVAASGLVYPVDALPGPLAAIHPYLPLTWAADALGASIDGGSAAIAQPIVVLVAWLVGALLVTLLVTLLATARPGGPAASAGVGSAGLPDATGPG